MAVLFASAFSSDVDGSNVLAADYPDYPVTLNGTGGTLTYTTARFINDPSGMLVTTTGGDRFLRRDITPVDEVWSRIYLYITTAPSGGPARVLRFRENPANIVAGVQIESNGRISITNGGSTIVFTSTTSYTGQWVRLEWRGFTNATNGEQNLRIFSGANLHGNTLTAPGYEASGTVAAQQFAGGINTWDFGAVVNTTGGSWTLDAARLNDTGWIGPVGLPPVANFTATPLSGTAPLSVAFTNTTTGVVTETAWQFGDGGSSAATNPTYVYQTQGTYLASLTSTNLDGFTQAQRTITVSPVGNNSLWTLDYETLTAGDAFSDSRFTTVVTGATAAATVVSTDVIKGTKALDIDARTDGYLFDYALATSASEIYYRTYMTVTKKPINGVMLLGVARQAGAAIARFGLNEHGKFSLWRGDVGTFGALTAETKAAVSVGTPLRVEWRVTPDATGANQGTQRLRVFIGSNVHGTTPDIGLTGGVPGTAIENFRWGIQRACDGRATFDATSFSIQNWLGPAVGGNSFTGVPIAGFVADKLVIDKGDSVIFTDRSTSTPTSYAWDFGGAGTSTTASPTKTFANGGTFTVTLVATNASGPSNTARLTVTAIDQALGKAVPRVAIGGVFKAEPATAPDSALKVRTSNGWQHGMARVYHNGMWSSDTPLGDVSTAGGGWGVGTAKSGTWMGTSLGWAGTPEQSYQTGITTLNEIDIIRVFDRSWAADWGHVNPQARLYTAHPEIKVVHYSFKMSLTEMAIPNSGTAAQKIALQTKMATWAGTIPDTQRVWITCWHEPEQEIAANDFSKADWKAVQKMWQEVIQSTRDARTTNKSWLKYMPILMGITVGGQRGPVDDWHPLGMDAYGVDPYYVTNMDASAKYYADKGWDWVAGEFGVDSNDATLKTYLIDQWDTAMNKYNHPPRALEYWSAIDTTGFNSLLDLGTRPEACRVWRSVCQKAVPPTDLWP